MDTNDNDIIGEEVDSLSDDNAINHLFETNCDIDLNNESLIYESFDVSVDGEDNYLQNINTIKPVKSQTIGEFCINNCNDIIKRLIDDNEELKKYKQILVDIEEQNVELIKDKEVLQTEINQLKESFEKRLSLKSEDIDCLNKSLFICESLNTSLLKELDEKNKVQLKLESYVKELEDKLYYLEMQLMESQKIEQQLTTSYESARQAYTEEEDNRYKTLEQLQSVYVECAQQQNDIKDLKINIHDLEREIADKDNELWFYKTKFDDSFRNSVYNNNNTTRKTRDSQTRDSILFKTHSEIPDYSFSVNEDEMDHIFKDFNDESPVKPFITNSDNIYDENLNSCFSPENISPIKRPVSDESNELHNRSEIIDNSETVVTNGVTDGEDLNIVNSNEVVIEKYLSKWFCKMMTFLAIINMKTTFRVVLSLILLVFLTNILLTQLFATKLPAYTSWEEIIYKLFTPYLTKVKTSKTQ
ncbi:arrestin domain-containing protein F-like [Oppia nitens]|uniref:arrestin domain-containing protein F-like n=1 Tax=Oppia nitens TaxID=1686743 RepID=UPI0023DBB2FB|nr:arrestin domain-containing protein F-like [Oppia nitens]